MNVKIRVLEQCRAWWTEVISVPKPQRCVLSEHFSIRGMFLLRNVKRLVGQRKDLTGMFSDRSYINLQEIFGLDCDENRSFKLGNNSCRYGHCKRVKDKNFIRTLLYRHLLRELEIWRWALLSMVALFSINSHRPLPNIRQKMSHLRFRITRW